MNKTLGIKPLGYGHYNNKNFLNGHAPTIRFEKIDWKKKKSFLLIRFVGVA